MPAWLARGETPPSLQTAVSSLCPRRAERETVSSLCLLIRASTPRPSHLPIPSPWVLSSNIGVLWGGPIQPTAGSGGVEGKMSSILGTAALNSVCTRTHPFGPGNASQGLQPPFPSPSSKPSPAFHRKTTVIRSPEIKEEPG